MADLNAGRRTHIFTTGHKASPNNPGERDDTIAPHQLAYRTALCGQVRYSRLHPNGGTFRWQDGETVFGYVKAFGRKATCETCRKLRGTDW